MSYALQGNSRAIDAGLDLATVYPFLPQDATTKVGRAVDIGAREFGITRKLSTVTLNVGTLIQR